MDTYKNTQGNRVKIIDASGNEAPNQWSRAKALTLAADFDPGFPFHVYVIEAGTLVVHPSDNDTENPQINDLEKAYYKGNVSITVPALTYIPFLCDKVIFSGSDTFDLVVGR